MNEGKFSWEHYNRHDLWTLITLAELHTLGFDILDPHAAITSSFLVDHMAPQAHQPACAIFSLTFLDATIHLEVLDNADRHPIMPSW